jgi:hypothetical protein
MADIDLSGLTPRDQDTADSVVVMKEGSPDEMGLVPRARFQSAQLITAAPSSDQANWTPSGFGATSAYIKLQPTTNSWLTGIAAGATDQFLTLFNDSDFVIAIETESSASTAANRFRRSTPLGSEFILPQESVDIRYSGTLSRWVVFGRSRDLSNFGARTHTIVPRGSNAINFGPLGDGTTQATITTATPTGTPTNAFLEYIHIQATNSTAASTAGVRTGVVSPFMRGATAGRQGFFHFGMVRFPALGATGAVRAGMLANTSVSTTLNSASVNCLFVGAETSQTTLQVIHNDAAGAAVEINLGANFPCPDANAAYEYAFYAPSGSSFVRYMVRRLDSRFVAEGSLTSDLPVNTTAISMRAEVMVGATAVANTVQAAYLYTQGL